MTPAALASRLASIIERVNRIYRRRASMGRPVYHLPRRAKRLSDAYLTALAAERESA